MQKFLTIDEAIDKLYRLNVGVVGHGSERHERPHKPVLLLAVLDLIASRGATAERIPWSQDLRKRFTTYFEIVEKKDDRNSPDNPFYYLKSEGFWEAFAVQGGSDRALATHPTASQAKDGSVYARVSAGMEVFFRSPDYRARLREALISRYFPTTRSQLISLFVEPTSGATEPGDANRCKEEEDDGQRKGRDPAFRRIVLEAYDFQCVACGLRIKLPDAGVTFVDGAHIIPFQESRNDHPTNGLALCKNHHWAMDRFLIVPTPDGVWKTSSRLDPRRSPGEEALVKLHDQPLLPPHDDAFKPDRIGLEWRSKRIYG